MWWLLVGCPKPAPVESAPDGPPPSPHAAFELMPVVHVPTAFTVARTLDVAIRGVGGSASGAEVARDGVYGVCGDPCDLPHVVPGEVISLASRGGAKVLEVALAEPPVPTAIGQGVTLVPRVELPSGPAFPGQLTLNSPAEVTLTWRAVHAGPDHRGVHQPSLALYGARGPEQPHTMVTFDPPERDSATWSLGAGTYAVRGALDDPISRFWCEPNELVAEPPAWCDPPPDGAPYDLEVTLEVAYAAGLTEEATHPPAKDGVSVMGIGRRLAVATPAPEPTGQRVPVPRGRDVVVRWTPREASLVYRWERRRAWAEGVCTAWPCVFPAAPFDAIWLGTPHVEAPSPPISVEVFVLAPPEPLRGLTPGHVLTTTLATRDGDPRPAFADLELTFDAPGTYRLGVKAAQGEVPEIEPLPGAWRRSSLELLGGDPTYDAVFVEVDAPGTFVARVTACPGCATQDIEVEVQRE